MIGALTMKDFSVSWKLLRRCTHVESKARH